MLLKDLEILVSTMALKNAKDVLMVWGPHGCGKTETITKVSKKIGWDFCPKLLSQRDASDITGLPSLVNGCTEFLPPKFIHQAIHVGKMIIFFDEFNMARKDVMASVFELLNERRIDGQKIKDDVLIICAGNPNDRRYHTTELSASAIDRLVHVKIESDVTGWLDWADQNAIDPTIKSFIKAMPDALRKANELDLKFPVELDWSERSWHRVDRMKKLDLPNNIFAETIRGIVGTEMSIAYLQKLEEKPLSYDEVLNYDKTTSKKFVAWAEERFDLVNPSADRLLEMAKTDLQGFNKKEVQQFILDLPNDVFARILRDLLNAVDQNKEKMMVIKDAFHSNKEVYAKMKQIVETDKSLSKDAA